MRRFYEDVGRRLRQARLAAGLTQQELAVAVDLSRASIANMEAGRQPFPAYTLVLLARALKVPIEALLPSPETLEQDDPGLTEAEMEGLDERSRNWVRKVLASPKEVVG